MTQAQPSRSPKAKNKTLRSVVWVLVGLGVAALIVLAWLPQPLPVELASVSRGDLRVTIDEVGRTRVRDRYVVSAPMAANVDRIQLEPGDPVDPETVLVRLAPLEAPLLDTRSRAQAEAQVQKARAAQKQAEASMARVELARGNAQRRAEQSRALAARGSISAEALEQAELEERLRAEELASARFAAEVAGHEIKQARALLARFSSGAPKAQLAVTSPASGSVLRVLRESAGVVQPGTPLLEVGDASALEVVSEILTADAVSIPKSAKASIERWGGPTLKARVRRVEPSAFSRMSALGVEEQRVLVVLEIAEPPHVWQRLGDGYRVEVQITTWEQAGVLQVPSGALFRRDGRWSAFVVEDGRARIRNVEVGKSSGIRVEVLKGLSEGEGVVLYPSDRIQDGVRVTKRDV